MINTITTTTITNILIITIFIIIITKMLVSLTWLCMSLMMNVVGRLLVA